MSIRIGSAGRRALSSAISSQASSPGTHWSRMIADELHALPRAEGGDGGFGIAHDDGAPALARGERRDQPALRRFVVNQHQQVVVRFQPWFPRSVPWVTERRLYRIR